MQGASRMPNVTKKRFPLPLHPNARVDSRETLKINRKKRLCSTFLVPILSVSPPSTSILVTKSVLWGRAGETTMVLWRSHSERFPTVYEHFGDKGKAATVGNCEAGQENALL